MRPQSPYDPPIRYLELRGATVAYTDDGTRGQAFVFLHGVPGSVRDFRWLEAALREKRLDARAVRISMPGFGGTDVALGGKMSLAEQSRFVTDFLDKCDLDEVTLIGHSLGGPAAIATAAAAPERLRCLSLIASVGISPHRAYRAIPYPPLLASVVCNPIGKRLLSRPLRKGFVKGGFSDETPTDELLFAMRAIGSVRFPAIRTAVAKVAAGRIPTHVFAADDDPMIEPEIAQDLAAALAGRLHAFDGGGHNIQKTLAVEIAETLAAQRPE